MFKKRGVLLFGLAKDISAYLCLSRCIRKVRVFLLPWYKGRKMLVKTLVLDDHICNIF